MQLLFRQLLFRDDCSEDQACELLSAATDSCDHREGLQRPVGSMQSAVDRHRGRTANHTTPPIPSGMKPNSDKARA